jgi:putative phage-type endonuclease
MMRVVQHPQGSPEWLQARVGIVTASRVGDILATTKSGPSASRAGYLGELVAEQLTGVSAAPIFMNDDMRRGVELEPAARFAYEMQTEQIVQKIGLVLHPTMKAGASPDGLVGDEGLVEIKCPRTHVHIGYIEGGKPPAKYLAQMGWQLVCTGRKWVDFVSYDERMPEALQLFIVRFEPTMEVLQQLTREVSAFLAEVDEKVNYLSAIARKAA